MLRNWLLFALLLPMSAWTAPVGDDPCLGMLAVLNRPTVGDSVCVVKPGKVMVEMGTQYQDLYPEHGHAWNFPEAQFRFGLPGANEITVIAPNYIDQFATDNQNTSGFGATVVGYKHQFMNQRWGISGETLFTLPTGSKAFGSDDLGFALNGIVSYSLTETFGASFMFGYTRLQDVDSVNPDLVLTWQCLNMLQLYSEVYGQTKTGPDEGSGFNMDAGIQYLPSKNIELDVEYGQRLTGQLAGFSRYYGIGAGFRF